MDLTDIINRVVKLDLSNWCFNSFFITIDEFKRKGLKVSFWENEENWASISNADNITVGYLWNKYPLLFIESRYLSLLSDTFNENNDLTIISVDSLHSDLFRMDDNLASLFDSYINLNSFTAEDLWFVTNSK
ncbi:hypothetical protein SAMN05443634_11213 [Chishuiella changwenlii]|uniref:Uncharacterized protein n=1 Tax=Chishuiella changwenlii TaxID=1434701 RepID=A0A1M7BXZ0_9FLAO|nr:hypothetical protein [Chishuiella changwenlii]GGE91482.1 hypothetical protein GCM10010984_06500 [Chishuiella changwenlii]SHL59726.1 hypothetical protein SAMN05443634_11213 [Chishuiella changwenlii]